MVVFVREQVAKILDLLSDDELDMGREHLTREVVSVLLALYFQLGSLNKALMNQCFTVCLYFFVQLGALDTYFEKHMDELIHKRLGGFGGFTL